MSHKTYEVADLTKAFGKREYVILDRKYQTSLADHPLVSGLWTVGRYFVVVGNMERMTLDLITGDCARITGFTCKEIEQLQGKFMMGFGVPQHMGFNMSVVKLAMEYLHHRDPVERDFIYVVYFYKALKKDGQVITIQHQSIPIVFDELKVPFIFTNIFTDISYLGITNTPQAILVNRYTDEVFNINPTLLELVKCEELFSRREKEVVQLLINGYNSRQIGEKLFISMETVRTHRKNILKKAGLNNTTELVGYAMTHGVV